MGTGYTRNDTSNNIADGNVINASDLDGEYDAIESAFGTSGHTHDGTSGEGGPVTVLGPVQDFVVTASVIKPKTDNTLDIGTSSLEFKDLYLDGLAYIDGLGETMLVATDKAIQFRDTAISINSSTDGQLDIDADTEIEITSPTVDINASTVVNISTDLIVGDDLTLQSDAAVLNFGADSDVSLTHVADTGLLLNAGSAIQFRDSALAINSSADGQLDIIADTQLEITTPTLELNSDSQVIAIGADGDVTITHEADTGLKMQAASGFELNLQTGDTSVESGNVLGKITFNAPSESSGSDALLDGAAIEAVAEATFASDNNSTALVFKTNTSAAATERMRLKSDGTLNVDGTVTADKLDVGTITTSTLASLRLKTAGSNNAVALNIEENSGNEGWGLGVNADGDLKFYNSGTGTSTGNSAVTFSDDDKVGIGTASPQQLLHISANNPGGKIRLEMGQSGVADGDVTGEIQFYHNDSSGAGVNADIKGICTSSVGAGALTFGTGTTSTTERMRINSSGHVGIGDASPSNKLSVVAADGDADNAYVATFQNQEATDDRNFGVLIKAGSTSTDSALVVTDHDASNNLFVVKGNGNTLYFGDLQSSTAGTSNFRAGVNAGNSITSGGNYNVLIGDEAGTAITTGQGNVAIGYVALDAEDEHGYNVAIGFEALTAQNAGANAFNVAIGASAGATMSTGSNNVLLGTSAGQRMTTAIKNVVVGTAALDHLEDADFNVAVGHNALTADTFGSGSTAIGYQALQTQNFTTATDSLNVAVGYNAGLSVTTARGNTLVGSAAGDALTVGNANVAMGYNSLGGDTKGDRNVAIGYEALLTQDFTTSTDSYNTAVGFHAGTAITTGVNNTLIGGLAGDALTTGEANIAIGVNALGAETEGDSNVAIGTNTLANQNGGSSAEVYNTGVGHNAGRFVTTGKENTLIGALAGDALTDADFNVALGWGALGADTKGNKTVAIGVGALDAQNFTTSTDVYNVAVGHGAGGAVTTGDSNTLIGGLAGDALTVGNANVAVGRGALGTDTKGDRNIAIGYEALANQNFTTSTDSLNTAIGYQTAHDITTGFYNTLIGGVCGDQLTDADYNVAMGVSTLGADTLGSRTTAIGYAALASQNFTTATNTLNTAVGFQAGLNIANGVNNTAIGGEALEAACGNNNTALGAEAGTNVTGDRNTAIGQASGDSIVSGNDNITIGQSADVVNGSDANVICIGVNITATSNDFSFGKASNVVTNDFDTDANWSRSSDERLKKNITDQKLGLDFINDLRTVKYNWKASTELDDKDAGLNHLRLDKNSNPVDHKDYDGTVVNNMNTTATMHNFIAQEVKAALDKAGVSDFSGWSEDHYGVQQVSREMFVIPLVKAVQELSTKVTTLEAEVTKLKGE